MDFIKVLIKEIVKNKVKDINGLLRLRDKLTKEYKPKEFPSLIKIFLSANEEERKVLSKLIKVKPTRSISGVIPVAIMTKPYRCTNNERCIYCPGGLKSVFGDVPQSYTGNEPASMRAIRNNYDPYLQVFNRLEHYVILNHVIDKVELIIMGGNFNSLPKNYKEEFIKYGFKGLNDFSKLFFKGDCFNYNKFIDFFELRKEFKDPLRTKLIQNKLLKLKGDCDLKKEQLKNENSKVRCVALCLENRPDYCKKKNINEMLRFGTTRVEIGIQSIYNEVLKKVRRGHTVEDSIKATQLLKDSFLKTTYHIMPGLSSYEKDKKMFKEIFSNQDFKPDALKIYPCMVFKGTKLYDLYKKGKYKPLTTEKAAKLIYEIKKYIPEYCRVLRIQRDVPSKLVEAGVDITNLRQYIYNRYDVKCKCIRCREPKGEIGFDNLKLIRRDYKASGGYEIFLSFEEKNKLFGFCRLRIPYKPFRKEITNKSAGIRELHVYGSSVAIGKKDKNKLQHKGLGSKLMKEAEKIAREEFDIKKMLVISGIGVKNYYIKLGYKKDGVYMGKLITD